MAAGDEEAEEQQILEALRQLVEKAGSLTKAGQNGEALRLLELARHYSISAALIALAAVTRDSIAGRGRVGEG